MEVNIPRSRFLTIAETPANHRIQLTLFVVNVFQGKVRDDPEKKNRIIRQGE
jgi:hypothetical protein